MAALYELCMDGKLDEVRAALARGGDVNDKDSDGRTALMWAVWKNNNSIVKLLLDQPAVKVNEKDDDGWTALHFAAWSNNPEGARMLLLHPGFNSADSTNNDGETALMKALRLRKKEVLLELVKHESVNLDLSEGAFDERNADLRLIIEEAKTRRAQVSNQAANIQSGASRLSRVFGKFHSTRVSNPEVGNKQSGASGLSGQLGISLSLNDDDDSVSGCKKRCKQELEELQKHQNERVQLLLREQEEKEQKMKVENQKKLEESVQRMKKENKQKEEALKAENERVLSLLLEENESQEALMLAKHEGEERAARKEAELETERNASLRPSAPSQPQVPECPVCLEEMAPPTRIFQCRNGHLICEPCKTGLRPCICPKCRQEMTGRATDTEAILRSFQQK